MAAKGRRAYSKKKEKTENEKRTNGQIPKVREGVPNTA
jgi:hypothetical protein